MAETTDDRKPDGIWQVVEDLVRKVEILQAQNQGQPVEEGPSASWPESDPDTQVTVAEADSDVRRQIPTEGDPVDLDDLAEWVTCLLVRYGAAGDWLSPCWWRHGLVVEELAALRMAWLGAYNATQPPNPEAAVKWHEAAEKCRQRIRQTISIGTGCSPGSHRAEDPITNDPRWKDELDALAARPKNNLNS